MDRSRSVNQPPLKLATVSGSMSMGMVSRKDPGEPSIAGVTVHLYSAGGTTLLNTAITDAYETTTSLSRPIHAM